MSNTEISSWFSRSKSVNSLVADISLIDISPGLVTFNTHMNIRGFNTNQWNWSYAIRLIFEGRAQWSIETIPGCSSWYFRLPIDHTTKLPIVMYWFRPIPCWDIKYFGHNLILKILNFELHPILVRLIPNFSYVNLHSVFRPRAHLNII